MTNLFDSTPQARYLPVPSDQQREQAELYVNAATKALEPVMRSIGGSKFLGDQIAYLTVATNDYGKSGELRSRLRVQVWEDVLGEYPAWVIKRAVQAYVRQETETPKGFPETGQIIFHIKQDSEYQKMQRRLYMAKEYAIKQAQEREESEKEYCTGEDIAELRKLVSDALKDDKGHHRENGDSGLYDDKDL